MEDNVIRPEAHPMEQMAEQLVYDLLDSNLDCERIEVQFLTTGTYHVIVQERGQEPREPIVVP